MTKPSPKTVFIAGTRRGAGKTMVTAFLLRSLPGAGAVKITCCRPGERCPRERPCGVCGALSSPFAVIQDRDVLATPRKDTARLLAAASGKVVWLQAREGSLAEGLRAALALFEAARGTQPRAAVPHRCAVPPAVLVEGNAAFQAFPPDLGLLVVGAGPAKPSVNVALPLVSAVVVNTAGARASVGRSLPQSLLLGLREDVRVFRFDVSAPEADPEAMAFIRWVKAALSGRRDKAR